MTFEQALTEVKHHVSTGGFKCYLVEKNSDLGRYISVMMPDGYWDPVPFWQEFHEEYFENTSGF